MINDNNTIGNESDIVENAKNEMTEKQIEEVLKYFKESIEWFLETKLEDFGEYMYDFYGWAGFCENYGFEPKYKNVIELFDVLLEFIEPKIKIDTDKAKEKIKIMEVIETTDDEIKKFNNLDIEGMEEGGIIKGLDIATPWRPVI
jgi:hypothetical protein